MNHFKNKKVYLDNSSTTAACKEVIDKILEVMKENYANASSLHAMGLQSENLIDQARDIISEKINCDSSEIIFTSGGTESNNLAILGCAKASKHKKNIVTTSVEHPSVIEPLKFLMDKGYNVTFINPKMDSFTEKIYNAINEETFLVSVMMVNNETGIRFPCDILKKIVKQKKSSALVHVDAVQAFCKIPIDVKKMGIDLMSMSAHKIHGPKGIGALYVSKGINIKPIMFGGGQQRKIRSGTEPVSLIAGFGRAVEMKSDYNYILDLKNYCVKRLLEIEGVKINSSEDSLAYILNFSLPYINSETLLHYLASKNIFVSNGSACSKGKDSYVLEKMGIKKELIKSAVRVSFSRYNTLEDVDLLVDALYMANKELIKRENV